MQTFKISVVIAALIAGAPLTMRATDTPAQAAARAVVEQKLRELEAQSPETNSSAPAPVMIAPMVTTPPPANTVAVPVMTPISETKAGKKAAKLKAKQDAEKAAAQIEAARAEAAKKQAAENARLQMAQPLPPPTADVGQEIGLRPVAAPPLPIASAKAARLQALLAKYQADQISPEDYHKQRAAILAEP